MFEKLEDRQLLAGDSLAPGVGLAVVRQVAGDLLFNFEQRIDGRAEVDQRLRFGLVNDPGLRSGGKVTPIVGDWNRSGYDWPGVVIQHHNGGLQFKLDNDGEPLEEYRFYFGWETDQFAVADVNGDGYDDIVVARPGQFTDPVSNKKLLEWYISYGPFPTVGSPGTDTFLPIHDELLRGPGLEGDQIILGDWNGDGRAELGVISKDPVFSQGVWVYQWWLPMPSGIQMFPYGGPITRPIVGNWDGSGGDNIGVVWDRPGAKPLWQLDTNWNIHAEIESDFTSSGVQYLAGRWFDFRDTIAPTAQATSSNITSEASAAHWFPVTYRDNEALDCSTINQTDVYVRRVSTGQEFQPVNIGTQFSCMPGLQASQLTASYAINAPGGTWDAFDNGSYDIYMRANEVRDTRGNAVAAGKIGSFEVAIPLPDTVPPTATLISLPVPKLNDPHADIQVRYDDNVAVNVASFATSNIHVTGPGSQVLNVLSVSSNQATNGTPRTATYRVQAPGGSWDDSDNGRYEIFLLANSVRDTSNNYAPGGKLGEFHVNLTPTDTVPPQASLRAEDVSTRGVSHQLLTVTYVDNRAVNVASLDGSDIRVTGPNGYDVRATLKRVDQSTNGSPRIATYEIAAPGGTWNAVDNGTYIVWIVPNQVQDTSGNSLPGGELGRFSVLVSDFDIELVFLDDNLTTSQRAVFQQAVTRWQEIILGDLPDVYIPELGIVDDLVIYVEAPWIDGPGGVLGRAKPTVVRANSFLPIVGEMRFDSADLERLELNNRLRDVIIHEMGHVLGFGMTIWTRKNLLEGAGGTNPRFLGAQAAEEYRRILGATDSNVPVENTGGVGTRDSHWRESVFDNELMTGWIDLGRDNPLSRITAASLADLGYVVNLNAADVYPSDGVSVVTPTDLEILGVRHEPNAIVDLDYLSADELGLTTMATTYLKTTRMLSMMSPEETIVESNGPLTVVVTKTILDEEVTVSLTSSAPDRVWVPASVTIPAGALEASFTIIPTDDRIFAPTATVTIRAEAADHSSSSVSLTLTDDDPEMSPWQNPRDPMDINDDGRVTPLDALMLINEINLSGSGHLTESSWASGSKPLFVDSSGDGVLSSLDVLLVVNQINWDASRLPSPALSSSRSFDLEQASADSAEGEQPFPVCKPVASAADAVFAVLEDSDRRKTFAAPGEGLGFAADDWLLDVLDMELDVAADAGKPR